MLTFKVKNLKLVLFGLIAFLICLLNIQISLAEPSSSSPTVTLSPITASTSTQPKPSPWFYGGSFGAAFGDVEYIEVSPLVGYHLSPKTSVGASFLYRYGTDKRFSESYSTTDYGTTLFGRYNLTPTFYLQAEYEYIDYEFAILNLQGKVVRKERDNFSSYLAGAGIQKPLGGNAAFYFTALYNFSYDDKDSPYSDPLVVRLGIGVGF